jgi:hypothetical protein
MLALAAGIEMQYQKLKCTLLLFDAAGCPVLAYNSLMQVRRHCIAPRHDQCITDWHYDVAPSLHVATAGSYGISRLLTGFQCG